MITNPQPLFPIFEKIFSGVKAEKVTVKKKIFMGTVHPFLYIRVWVTNSELAKWFQIVRGGTFLNFYLNFKATGSVDLVWF